MKLKVLHIVWSGQIGGAETVLYHLLTAMNNMDTVDNHIGFMTSSGPLIPLFEQLPITTHQFNFRNKHILLSPAELRRFHRLLLTEQYDVIHVHTSFMMAILAKLCSTSVILSTNHGGSLLNSRASIIKQKIANGFIDHHIAVSKLVRDKMIASLKINPVKIDLIYNGLPVLAEQRTSLHHPEEAFDRSEDSIVIGTIGRLVPLKKIDQFILAASKIVNEIPHAKFVIIGDGPSKPELEALVQKLGLQSSVSFLGQITNARKMLRSFDIFCFTSMGDALGMVVLEAMDANVPVVAYHNGSIEEIIQHRYNGMIVEPTYHELAHAVIDLIQHPLQTKQLIQRAKATVASKFSIARMAEETLTVYQRLAKSVMRKRS